MSNDQRLAYAMYVDQNNPQRQLQLIREIDKVQREQAKEMMKYGMQANLMGSLLKDVPRAITNAAYQDAVYADEIAQGPIDAARSIPTRFGSGNRGYFSV